MELGKGKDGMRFRKRSLQVSGVDRSVKEKNRRMRMKILVAELASFISHQSSQHDTLEEATKYLKQLQERLKQLKEKRDKLKQEQEQEQEQEQSTSHLEITTNSDSTSVEVNLIFETSNSKKSFMLHQLIAVLEQEGAQVLSVNFSTVATKMFYTIKSEAIYSRIGIETSRLQERLKNLVFC